ncbi:MAG: adenylate/guanylate cyclase domain-containing protein, partial [Phycisphaeraceae bacterium]|nr:adenylate/guanylate cyclase domain-containing protein [Phycisphaeraceae bacterium]
MNRFERKLLIRNVVLGLIISLALVISASLGWVGSLEQWFYDLRVQQCQFSQQPPTDQLIHLDIDDSTLEKISAWPWPRQVLAQVIDELNTASAKVIALDVVFPEPQQPRLIPHKSGPSYELIPDDKLLAQAISQSHHSLLSVAVSISTPDTSGLLKEAYHLVNADLNLEHKAFALKLQNHPDLQQELEQSINLDTLFIRTRKKVLFDHAVKLLINEPDADFLRARAVILPHLDVNFIGGSPLLSALQKQFDRAQSMDAIHRYTTPHSGLQLPATPVEAQLPPIAILSQAATGAGFVNYQPDNDGVVRSIPLTVSDGKRALPQLGLALACGYLGVHPRDIRYFKNHVEIPKPDGSIISLPVREQYVSKVNQQIRYLYDVPWFGPVDHWEYMYDPHHKQTAQHLPLYAVYRVSHYRDEIRINNQQIDMAISNILDDDSPHKLKLNPQLGKTYRESKPQDDDVLAREQMVSKLKKDDFVAAVYADFLSLKPEDLSKEDLYFKTALFDAYRAMDQAIEKNKQWIIQITEARKQLKKQVAGKAVIIGWAGTAAVADFVQTPLHHRCPGVVVHGTIFNAILNGESWTRVPSSVNIAMILSMGLLATALVALLSPIWALTGCLAIAGLYLGINGLLLFDRMNLLVEVAAPLLSVGLVWSGCTLNRFIVERTERTRITRRFSSYVDPALVNYVINNPDTARLDGELKEMTVVFTDLAGFTTLSEKLRERTVPILNEYMGLMVPIIRKHTGYVNKFLGDGMMFFYAAPLDNPNHASDAVITSLELQHAMIDFNRRLKAQDLPQVAVRIGMSTGEMVVGDAGSEDASDYTVLGDTVNLAARLES